MNKFLFAPFLIGCLLCISQIGLSQNDALIIMDEAPGPQAVYQIYLGNVQPGQSMNIYSDVSHLGFLRTFSIQEPPLEQGPSRASAEQKVFLGPFLGEKTAKEMMEKVLNLGYIDAYLEKDEAGLSTPSGTKLTHTVQLGAFEQLDMQKFTKIANVPAHGVFVLYEDGLYKVLSGLYPSEEKEYIRKSVIPYMKKVWGMKGFLRAIDQAPVPTPNE